MRTTGRHLLIGVAATVVSAAAWGMFTAPAQAYDSSTGAGQQFALSSAPQTVTTSFVVPVVTCAAGENSGVYLGFAVYARGATEGRAAGYYGGCSHGTRIAWEFWSTSPGAPLFRVIPAGGPPDQDPTGQTVNLTGRRTSSGGYSWVLDGAGRGTYRLGTMHSARLMSGAFAVDGASPIFASRVRAAFDGSSVAPFAQPVSDGPASGPSHIDIGPLDARGHIFTVSHS